MASESEKEAGPGRRSAESEPSARVWQEFLSTELRCPVRVVYTRARRTPLQVRPVSRIGAPGGPRARSEDRRGSRSAHGPPSASGLEVRMHAMFEEAPAPVHEAVVRWIRSGRRAPRACAILDRWIMESLERLPVQPPRDAALRARGRHHDLEALASELIANELAAELAERTTQPRVTWGKKGQSRTRHSLRLGSFDPEGSLVRIHPVLDQDAVPSWFVRYVVFHELLHAVLPPRLGRGSRWIHHGAEFRRRERAYADYARAIDWEKAHMSELIRSARRSTPMRVAESRASAAPRTGAAVHEAPSRASAPSSAERAPVSRPKPERPAVVRFIQDWLFPH